jgi:superfamily I DNA/RNA helicase
MLTHITTASEENQINPQLLGINAVTLSTIHKAKGLE